MPNLGQIIFAPFNPSNTTQPMRIQEDDKSSPGNRRTKTSRRQHHSLYSLHIHTINNFCQITLSKMGDQISLAPEPAPKRRKLRKGTQSCWECKRRKAKCIFSDSLGICDSCKRRGTDCVSQDTDENPPPLGSNKHLVDRLGEVEALVQHLLKQSSERRSDDRLSPESLGSGRRSHDERRRSDSSPAFLTETVVDAHENGVTTVSQDDTNLDGRH